MVSSVPTASFVLPLLVIFVCILSSSSSHALEIQQPDTNDELSAMIVDIDNDLDVNCLDCYVDVASSDDGSDGNNNVVGEVVLDSQGDFFNRTGSATTITQEPIHGWGSNRPHGVDVLVATFFLIAAGWLFMAIIYSIIILIILRLQSRGELDIYDENFGRMFCCNGRFSINFSCILRRYAIQLEQEQQRRAMAGLSDGSLNEAEITRRVRIMTRDERRLAIETLLAVPAEKAMKVCVEHNHNSCENKNNEGQSTSTDPTISSPPSGDTNTSIEGPLCSICLGGYESDDQIFTSSVCSHQFHSECIMNWLERRNNTECPCCRIALVSDDDVWEVVRNKRKERRRQLRRENGPVHRMVKFVLGRRLTRFQELTDDDEPSITQQDTMPESPVSGSGGGTHTTDDIEVGRLDSGSTSESESDTSIEEA